MATVDIFRNARDVNSCPAGHTIFHAGEPGHEMYAVKDGEVDIVVHGQVVETVGPGGIFGEMALIDAQARSATAIAKTDCQLVPIDEKRFSFLIQQTPFFALSVMRTLVARLRKMDEEK